MSNYLTIHIHAVYIYRERKRERGLDGWMDIYMKPIASNVA